MAEVVGILVGTRLVHRVKSQHLRMGIGSVCLVVGSMILIKALSHYF